MTDAEMADEWFRQCDFVARKFTACRDHDNYTNINCGGGWITFDGVTEYVRGPEGTIIARLIE